MPMLAFITLQRNYLQELVPVQRWQTIALILSACLAFFPLMIRMSVWNSVSVQLIAVPILIIYWLIQFRMMWIAAKSTEWDWQGRDDSLIGSLSPYRQNLAKVYAILRHHWHFILLASLLLLGLSLAMAGFFLFRNDNYSLSRFEAKWFLNYVGVNLTGYIYERPAYPFSISARVFYGLIMAVMLFVLTITSSIFSISLGLWAGRFGRVTVTRLLILGLSLVAFLGFYTLRESASFSCHRSQMQPDICDEVLLQMRLIDSFQAISLSFMDGGATLVTGLHSCGPREFFNLGGYQGRHLLAAICVVIAQFGLSAFFLRRASKLKKKKA